MEINSSTVNGPTLSDRDGFGFSVTSLGDLDGDGITDLAVGASGDDEGGNESGALHVLLLNADGSVKQTLEINSSTANGPILATGDVFGSSVAALGDLNADGVTDIAVGAHWADSDRGVVHILFLEPAPILDYGDAPDSGVGTGANNYETTATDGGPAHEIVAGLHLGATIDVDSGTAQNQQANADDVDGVGADDEDGVLSPATDLLGTVGHAPSVTLLVTNTTGSAATLAGWIDYDNNGVFEVSERATATINTGTTDGRITLTFPTVQADFTGTTYARFRLSTDSDFTSNPAPIGVVSDGEVEDYTFAITIPASGLTASAVEHDRFAVNGPSLFGLSNFGSSAVSLGDLDGDGVTDIAVGATDAFIGKEDLSDRGTVYVLFLNVDGSIKQTVEINAVTPNGPSLQNGSRFGISMASLGDLDGDGVTDIAVGAESDEGGSGHGAVHLVFLNADGSVKQTVEIDSTIPNGPTLGLSDRFGGSVTSLGDLDGDGVIDLAVGATGDNEGGSDRGAVHIVFLNADGSVKQTAEINSSTANGPTLANEDAFGRSVASLGDLDGDGVAELAVAASGDDEGGPTRGAVHVLFLNADGSVKQTVEVNSSTPNGPILADVDVFGVSMASVGDLDADGVTDLAVGATFDDEGGDHRGTMHVLLLNADGSVKQTVEINSSTANGPSLLDGDGFGSAVMSLGDLNGDGVTDLVVGASSDDDDGGSNSYGAVHVLFLAPLPLLDYGDAPDTGAGTGAGNYETTNADGGPSHVVTAGLRLGANVDGVSEGTLENGQANADDIDRALPDDEDGVPSPDTDLLGTTGTAPAVTLLVTNTSGSTATLAGWIDYDNDGVFETSERATATVNTGTNDGRVTLTFPTVPASFTGTTYARFRLSTDGSFTSNPVATGAASDGEVEDYTFAITSPGDGTLLSTVEINSSTTNGPILSNDDLLGRSMTSLGDLDGDGVTDIAVGSNGDDDGGNGRGAVHLLFLNSDGTVKQTVEINSSTANGPTLADLDSFGSSVTSLGDLDGDGVTDIAVGAPNDDEGGNDRGAVHVFFLNADGSVKQSVEINSNTVNGPALADDDAFGWSITSPGDLNGDGLTDLAVGAIEDDADGTNRGTVHLLFLNTDGSVKQTVEINSSTTNGPTLTNGNRFGSSVTTPGDLDGDGVAELAVGAAGYGGEGSARGAVHVLFLNTDGSVKQTTVIKSSTVNGPSLSDGDFFGNSATSPGDLDGDGVADLAVAAFGDDEGGDARGAIHVLFMNSDGSVKQTIQINDSTANGPDLANGDTFGGSLAALGDLNGDGVNDLAVGANNDDEGGANRGAIHLLFLSPPNRTPTVSVADLAYTEGDSSGNPVVIDSAAIANDLDGDADWNGGTLTVQITANSDSTDEISIAQVGGITLSGANVQADGSTTFGVITETSNTTNDGVVTNGDLLTITFNANATNALVQQLVRAISYRSTSENPNNAARTVTFTATDIDSGATSATPTISVASVADAPIMTSPANATVVNAPTFAITGTVEANALVRIYSDTNNNGTIDGSDTVVSSEQLTGQATLFSISTSLEQNASNNFLATATDPNGVESVSVDVPTITEDSTAPTVTVNIVDTALSDSDNSSVVTFEFSENVTGFDVSDVSVIGGTLSDFAAVDGDSFTATFTATDGVESTGSVTVATTYTDAAGNTGTTNSDNVNIDTLNPTVTVSGPGSPLSSQQFDATIVFSEPITGFTIGNLNISNGTVTSLTDNGDGSFTATIEVTADGTVTVDGA